MDVPARVAPVAPAEFLAVYRAHCVFVWHALRLCGVPDAALEDAAQDVFVVVHRRLPEFEGRAKVRTWIFEIARRVAARHRDRVRRDAARIEALPELAGADDPDAELDRTLAADILREFAETLDEDRLRVFVLAELGQLRGREIAEALDLNLNTVYARLRSAHKDLDRLTARLRAREARALCQAARERRPSKATRRRAWAAIAAKLGLPSATSAGGGAVVAGLSAKWSAVAIAALGVFAVVAVSASDDPAPDVRAQTQVPAEPPRPLEPAVARTSQPSPVSSVPPSNEPVSDVAESIPADSAAAAAPPPARTSFAARARTPEPEVAPAAPTAADLAAEVALVKELRRNLGKPASFAATLATYRRGHADGELATEVDALVIEHDCRRGQFDDAEAAIAAFEVRHPSPSLARRLRAVCAPKRGPQNPEAGRTQGT